MLAFLGVLALVGVAVALRVWPGAWRWVATAVVLLVAAGVFAATRGNGDGGAPRVRGRRRRRPDCDRR